ncbi:hypothetical protein [Thermogutta sp.]|uniref:hypothetical protein n=1 Tax=Thermogutta sp. TaxID=1962930 RepID=UPI00321FC240
MPNLSRIRTLLSGRGADLKVKATSTGLDIVPVPPTASTVGSRLRVTHAAGAAANTNIPISGITTSDVLVSVLEIQPPTATSGGTIKADQTANATINSNGNIRISQDTSGNQVLVIWWDVE